MPTRRFARGLPQHRAKAKKLLALFLTRKALTWGLVGTGIVFLFSAATVLWWSRDLPDPENINDRRVAESTKIFDASGSHLLYEIGEVHRTRIPLDRISLQLRQATLAAEDDQFYTHRGLDLTGIGRALFVNLTGGSLQGGSTITQQLIKNSILTPERTLRRKVKEAVLALELEQRFSKDQILEMYLNDIPYGSQAYGVEAAAQAFFAKSAADVSLAEAATLAALPKAPSYYSPYGSHFEDLKRRQEHILERMVALNMISREQTDEAKAVELKFQPRREAISAPHFVFYVKEQLEEQFGERLVEQGGLKVTTTLNADLQKEAENILKEKQASLQKLGASNAAVVAINPKNGDIVTMVGSIDYFNEEIDGNVNVAVRHRSPGSSIKPFVYAAAWQKGYTPQTILVDAETDFGKGYKPKNFSLQERGPVTMKTALATSLNIPAVKTLYLAGVKNSTQLAQKMGMTSLNDPDRYGLSLVLGGGEVRLLDEVSAYGVFANEGVRHPHRAILKVEDGDEVIFDGEKEKPQEEKVLEPQIARLINDTLSDNSARAPVFGAASPLQLGARPVAAKTGTTQEFRDGWTLGYIPSLAAGVWVGNNDNSPMKAKEPGVQTAAPIWNQFMRTALKNTSVEKFTPPEPLKNIRHGVMRGQLPEVKGKWDPDTQSFFSLECPVNVGQPKTFKELHSLLFYIRRDDPNGDPPATAENDPQFDRWENGVSAWRDKHNTKYATDFSQPQYVTSLPTPSCGVGDASELPKVSIVEPSTTIVRESPVRVKAEVDSSHPLKEVRFLLDNQEIARRGAEGPYEASFSFPDNFSGRKTLVVLAVSDNNLVGRAHRTFIINPDDSLPSITLHTPQNNSDLKNTNFPYTVKVTAKDKSGLEAVDVLYRKEGGSGTQRIGRTSTPATTAANRFEVIWDDSPGPGTYEVYAIAYDKTGNFTESSHHTVTIAE